MTNKIIKPWGSEELLEVNSEYVMKRLYMKKGHQCSLQYHEEKHETVYVISGELKLTIGDSITDLEEIILKENDSVVLPPKKIHRMFGNQDTYYLEASTPQLEDVVRIEDDYNRAN
tara:strand:- start:161 stop:508 length:348 start_codon:yes stop_codon:yes gene_type:complete